MITLAQLEAVAQLRLNFNAVTGNLTITDNSNWASLITIPPSNVLWTLRCTSPSGSVFYVNTNYGTNFSAPDLDINGGTTSTSKTLPTDSQDAIEEGTYLIEGLFQATIDGQGTVEGTHSVSVNYCNLCPGSGTVESVIDLLCGLYTFYDRTDYSNTTADSFTISRTLTLMLPHGSGVADVTGTGEFISSTPLYVGEYYGTLQTDVTYTIGIHQFVCRVTASERTTVEDDLGLCKAYCMIKAVRDKIFKQIANVGVGSRGVQEDLETYYWATSELTLAKQAIACGKQTDLNDFLNKLKEITGLDEDCCCGDDVSGAQIIPTCSPTTGLQGPQGIQGNPGPIGPTGGTGAAGQAGVGYLFNRVLLTATTTQGSDETMFQWTSSNPFDATYSSPNGDSIRVEAVFSVPDTGYPIAGNRRVGVAFNGLGAPLPWYLSLLDGTRTIRLIFHMHRMSVATSMYIERQGGLYSNNGNPITTAVPEYLPLILNAYFPDLDSNAVTLNILGRSDSAGDLILQKVSAVKYNKP